MKLSGPFGLAAQSPEGLGGQEVVKQRADLAAALVLVAEKSESASQLENRFKARSCNSRLDARVRIFLTLSKLVLLASGALPAKCQVAATGPSAPAWPNTLVHPVKTMASPNPRTLIKRIKDCY